MNKYSSLANLNRPRRRPRRTKRKTIIKRITVLTCFLVLIFLVVRGCTEVFLRLTAEPKPKVVTAKAAVWGRQYQCRALAVREEMVVVAPCSGVLNLIAEPMTKVSNGELVAEIVDRFRLAQMTERIEEVNLLLKQEGESRSPEEELAVADSREAEQALQASISRYCAVSSFNISEREQMYRAISEKAKRYLDLELAERQATKSREALYHELEQLQEQKKACITQLTAPQPGIFVPYADGLEAVLQPASLDKVDFRTVWVAREKQQVSHGSQLEKGELVYKIVKDGPWFLVVEISSQSVAELENASDIEITVDELKLSGTLQGVTKVEDNAYCLFAMEGPPVLLERYYTAQIKINTQKGVEIPAAAVTESTEGYFVKLATAEGVKQQPVKLLARKKDLVLVEGIPENAEVLVNEGKR